MMRCLVTVDGRSSCCPETCFTGRHVVVFHREQLLMTMLAMVNHLMKLVQSGGDDHESPSPPLATAASSSSATTSSKASATASASATPSSSTLRSKPLPSVSSSASAPASSLLQDLLLPAFECLLECYMRLTSDAAKPWMILAERMRSWAHCAPLVELWAVCTHECCLRCLRADVNVFHTPRLCLSLCRFILHMCPCSLV
jgi:hypothetical protein